MVSFPNAKINLGLQVIRKRADGYHDLETVFYPIKGLQDALEIVHGNQVDENPLFTISGLPINGDTKDNLCIKAYHLLKKDFPSLPPIQMHLHKAIPMGAGMGGGSADGAFTLDLLNRQFNLELNQEQLIAYALELGSDCPFFVINQPCFATSRGEQLEPISVDLLNYTILLINPGIHIPTGWAFGQLTPKSSVENCKTIVQAPVNTWRDRLINDFEAPVMASYPAIRDIKDRLYEHGAIYASMTGTGSTVYGIFEKDLTHTLSLPEHYLICKG
jgi:4-diphosphocytidyl-2-C-methyl-D-erythritol kinase